MKIKKVIDFLVVRDAMTSRNLTSLFLVAVLVGVYWASGGKISVPKVKVDDNFGGLQVSDDPDGVNFRGDVVTKPPAVNRPTRTTEANSQMPASRYGSAKYPTSGGNNVAIGSDKDPKRTTGDVTDSTKARLSDIEERLNRLGIKPKGTVRTDGQGQ